MSDKLYTIGHSTHDAAHFIALLKQHGINAVCDVRSRPYSHYNPQYNRESIAEEIKQNGMVYIFLGKELGARSSDIGCYVNGKMQFEKLAAEPLFQQGLTRLRQGMKDHIIALMCAEKDPITCHRTILVARHLRRECTVKHILSDGCVEDNAETEKRLMELLHIRPDMFQNEEQCIEDAYDAQGNKIAHVQDQVHENHERY